MNEQTSDYVMCCSLLADRAHTNANNSRLWRAQTYEQTNKRTDGQKGRQTHGQTDGETDAYARRKKEKWQTHKCSIHFLLRFFWGGGIREKRQELYYLMSRKKLGKPQRTKLLLIKQALTSNNHLIPYLQIHEYKVKPTTQNNLYFNFQTFFIICVNVQTQLHAWT